MSVLMSIMLISCGAEGESESNEEIESVEIKPGTGIDDETAVDSHIDFEVLQSQNPEIFAWLQVPGTNIDCPMLQSKVSDEYYRTHNAKGTEDAYGAAYIEAPSMTDMCDFNTVVHGNGDGVFEELINFENPDVFAENEEFYVYLPDNMLIYNVCAVFERENTSLIRDYSMAEAVGARKFLDYVVNGKIMGKQVREGIEDLSEYNFFTTLTVDNPESARQLVVLGVLTYDAAGTLDRDVVEEIELGPLLSN